MAKSDKATTSNSTEATKPKKARRTKASTVTTTPKKSTTKRTAPAASQVDSISKRLEETEKKLTALIDIIHNDLQRGQKDGPEGLAAKLRKAGLLA